MAQLVFFNLPPTHCRVCGRLLTDARSITNTIGPAILCVEVIEGDTLANIAHTYDVQPGILVDWNKRKFPSLITNPDLLEIGWVLCMPVGLDTNTPSPKSTP